MQYTKEEMCMETKVHQRQNKVKLVVMRCLTRAKFLQSLVENLVDPVENPHLRVGLVDTGNRVLAEATVHHFWAAGCYTDCKVLKLAAADKKWSGQNQINTAFETCKMCF